MTALGDDDLLRAIARKLGALSDDGEGITVAQLVASYINEEVRYMPKMSAKTRTSQLAPIVAKLGDRPVMSLTLAELRAYGEERLKAPGKRHGTTVSPSTVTNERRALRTACGWAAERSPPLLPDVPKPVRQWKPPAERQRQGALRLDDVEKLVRELPLWVGTLATVSIYSGARIGVVLQLRWNDIDFETGRIRVRMVDTKTKGRGKPRLLSPALRALEAHRDAVLAEHGVLPEFVFASFSKRLLPSRRGRVPYNQSTVHNKLVEAAERAGVTTEDGYVTTHHLRHGFWIEALQRWKLPIKVAMRRAGIKKLETAMRYGKVGDLEDDAAQLDAERAIEEGGSSRRGPSSSRGKKHEEERAPTSLVLISKRLARGGMR